VRENNVFPGQQPDGDAGDTPGVAAAPVALAGAIVPGVVKFIDMLSAQAGVFGVGTTAIWGSMLVLTSWVISGSTVPGGGLDGMSGVVRDRAAPFVGGPPGMELHMVVEGLPGCVAGDMVPVVLTMTGTGMAVAVSAVDGIIVAVLTAPDADAVFGSADIDGIETVVPPTANTELAGTVGIPGAITPIGVEQVTTVPGIVGSEASGTGANVVSGTPVRVVDEYGLGPLSGEVTIVPGVDERPMAVVPMVETWARLALQPNSRAAVVDSRRRIAIPSSVTT
jgi:hypothetical protein